MILREHLQISNYSRDTNCQNNSVLWLNLCIPILYTGSREFYRFPDSAYYEWNTFFGSMRCSHIDKQNHVKCNQLTQRRWPSYCCDMCIHQLLMESSVCDNRWKKNQIEKRDCDYTHRRHNLHFTNLNRNNINKWNNKTIENGCPGIEEIRSEKINVKFMFGVSKNHLFNWNL